MSDKKKFTREIFSRLAKGGVFFADTESYSEIVKQENGWDHSKIYIWGAKSIDSNELIKDYTDTSFWEYFINRAQSCIIYFHYLWWDWKFLKRWIEQESNLTRNTTAYEPLKSNQYRVFENLIDNKVYYVHMKFRIQKNGERKKFQIVLKCSSEMLTASIKDLGKSVGLVKGDDTYNYDTRTVYNDSNVHEILEYIDTDIEIQKRAFINFTEGWKINAKKINIDANKINVYNSDTASSITYKALWEHLRRSPQYKRLTYKKNKELFLNYDDYCLLDKGYAGGFTQFNPIANKGLYFSNTYIMKIDVNSMYPAQMVGGLPYGDVLTEKPKGTYCTYLEITIEGIKPRPGYEDMHCIKNTHYWFQNDFRRKERVIDKTNNNRYINTYDGYQQKIYYYQEEWDLLNKIYEFDVVHIKEYYMKTLPYLKDFIEKIYESKVEGKDKGDKAKETSSKIALNSSYGKFCQKPEWEVVFPKEDLKKGDIVLHEGVEYIIYGSMDKEDMMVGLPVNLEDNKKKYRHKGVGGYITSLARCTMLKVIIDNPQACLYWDTDSFFLDMTYVKKMPPIHKTKLGYWKEEVDPHEINFFGCIAAKKYGYGHWDSNTFETTISGVNKEITKEEFINLMDNKINELTVHGNKKKFSTEYGATINNNAIIKIKKGRL